MFKHEQFPTRGSQQDSIANDKASTRAVRAGIERWRPDSHDDTATISEQHCANRGTLPGEEGAFLKCLGAALIMRWNTLPAKLQNELFDDAGDMGELLDTSVLIGQIARFRLVHKTTSDGGKYR
jgi:hypothetical protein